MAQPTILVDAKYLRLVNQNGWEFVQRKGIGGIVGIVAVTDDQKLLLVEQFRPPVGASVIEIPAGLAGDVAGHENEPLDVAASRELLEETGYQAAQMTYLAAGASSAGLTNEIITLYRASGLTKVGPAAGDGGEQITLHEIPLTQVQTWLSDQLRAGRLIDLKVYAALHFAFAAPIAP